MKPKNESNEEYSAKEENVFDEFQVFPAERYSVKEKEEICQEEFKTDEIQTDETVPENREEEKESLRETLKRRLPKVSSFSTVAASTSAVVIASASVLGIVPVFSSSYGEILKDSIEVQDSVSTVHIDGKIKECNSDYSYYVLFSQYQSGEEIVEPEQKELSIQNKTDFSVDFPLSYGLDSYSYSIYCLGKEERIELYSESRNYEGNQTYQANYEKRKPTESRFDFLSDGKIQVSVDTGFESSYPEVFSYRIEAVDKNGTVYGTYSGREKVATFEILAVGEIDFVYHDIGLFSGEEIEYAQVLTTESSLLSLPVVEFSDDYFFDGTSFSLTYQSSTVYDLSKTWMEVTLDNGKEEHHKTVPLGEKLVLPLDDFIGEIGTLHLNGEIVFQDDRLDPYQHRIALKPKTYEMDYHFEIERVIADLSTEGQDNIPVELFFDQQIPLTYQIEIKSESISLSETIDVSDSYSLSSVPSGDGATLSITVLDEKKEVYQKMEDIIIYPLSEIQKHYVFPEGISDVNPGDSLVTYNDDGTVNLYRDRKFVSSDPNLFYDSMLFTFSEVDETTGKTTYLGEIHHRCRDRVSINENLTKQDYCFRYLLYYSYENVEYQMTDQVPSGSIGFDYSDAIQVETLYQESLDKTVIQIKNPSKYEIENSIKSEDENYTFDSFDSADAESYSLTLDGDQRGRSIQINLNKYSENYDEIASLVSIVGNRYDQYSFTI